VNRPLQLDERRQNFIGAYDETLSVAAMRVNNLDCLPLGIDGGDPAHAESGINDLVYDDLPILHWITSIFITG